jgi:phosphate/sulfate permease
MRLVPVLVIAATALALCACAVVSTGASVTGSVISTTVDVTGSVIGGVARTVTGGSDERESK